ncbi:MAG TPA: hypothetical protein VJN43_08390 [Bryobacteraceae bacterium]|nr:hypothetical protein [Bryobacteraceae bacterium]
MSLPQTVRVKLSSEAAGYVSITPVVVREMPTRELVEHMLGITGKDEARVQDLLLRGTLVSGASRFRWTGWAAEAEAVRSLLASFPDPDPGRPFSAAQCVLAVLRGGAQHPIGIPRDIGSKRGAAARILRRASFWDVLIGIAAAGTPQYAEYSYRERADVYHLPLSANEVQRLRAAARLVRYSALEIQIRSAPVDSVELYVSRQPL